MSSLIGVFYGLTIGLAVTIIVESIVIYLYGLTEPKVLKTAFFVNLITNPIMNVTLALLTMFLGNANVILYIIIFELIVIFAEYKLFDMVYHNIFNKNTIIKLVIIMNVVSYLIGILLSRLNILKMFLYSF